MPFHCPASPGRMGPRGVGLARATPRDIGSWPCFSGRNWGAGLPGTPGMGCSELHKGPQPVPLHVCARTGSVHRTHPHTHMHMQYRCTHLCTSMHTYWALHMCMTQHFAQIHRCTSVCVHSQQVCTHLHSIHLHVRAHMLQACAHTYPCVAPTCVCGCARVLCVHGCISSCMHTRACMHIIPMCAHIAAHTHKLTGASLALPGCREHVFLLRHLSSSPWVSDWVLPRPLCLVQMALWPLTPGGEPPVPAGVAPGPWHRRFCRLAALSPSPPVAAPSLRVTRGSSPGGLPDLPGWVPGPSLSPCVLP